MAGIEKLIEKMKSRPNGVRFNEVSKVLEHYGYLEVRVKDRTTIFATTKAV